MKFNLKNRPKLFGYYRSPDSNYDAIRKEVNEWFEGFEKELRENAEEDRKEALRLHKEHVFRATQYHQGRHSAFKEVLGE